MFFTAAVLFIVSLIVYVALHWGKTDNGATGEARVTVRNNPVWKASDHGQTRDASFNREKSDPQSLLDMAYSELEGAERQEVILKNLRELTRQDPEGAVNWVLAMAPDQTQNMAMALVFAEWGQHRPEDAASWIMQNLSIPQQLLTTAASSLATSWVGVSPTRALQWSDLYFDRTEQYQPFQDAIIAWSQKDVEAVARHIEATSYDGATRYVAMIDFVNIYAQQDLDGAREWVQANVPQDLQAAAQRQIIEELTKTRPSEAAAYVLQEANLAYFRSNLGALLSEWAGSDIVSASQWVDRALNASQKDIAHEQLAFILHFDRPQLAIQYAQALTNEADRIEITSDILMDWREQSRHTADKWISENLDTIDPVILNEVGYKEVTPAEP